VYPPKDIPDGRRAAQYHAARHRSTCAPKIQPYIDRHVAYPVHHASGRYLAHPAGWESRGRARKAFAQRRRRRVPGVHRCLRPPACSPGRRWDPRAPLTRPACSWPRAGSHRPDARVESSYRLSLLCRASLSTYSCTVRVHDAAQGSGLPRKRKGTTPRHPPCARFSLFALPCDAVHKSACALRPL
jgi:hypothetical protein